MVTLLIVEYKNETDWSNEDNKEKRDIGELWAGEVTARAASSCPRASASFQNWQKLRLQGNGAILSVELFEDIWTSRSIW